MGNAPISCCRSRTARLRRNQAADENYINGSGDKERDPAKYAKGRKQKDGSTQNEQQPSHILQHISEREPDDTDTDPSSNPIDRPLFAARSSTVKARISCSYTDNSFTSSNSTSIQNRSQHNTQAGLLTCSQDHGYNSTTSTNLTQYDGPMNDSFETSITCSKQVPCYQDNHEQPPQADNRNLINNNRLLDLNSKPVLLNADQCIEVLDETSPSKMRVESARPYTGYQLPEKVSSCSTIFVNNSSISQPDLKQMVQCVALAIYYHIKNRSSNEAVEIFDENLHPIRMPPNETEDQPDATTILDLEDSFPNKLDFEVVDYKTIHHFVKTLFEAAQLTSEYAITTLVYLERLMTYAEMDLTPRTWRRMFLSALLLSSKVWEDQAVWNVDYAQILEGITVDDINELESQFLELIKFNMNVPSSVYAKYYFHLRSLALKHGISREHSLLTLKEAKRLETMSRVQMFEWQSSPIHRRETTEIKRPVSLENMRQTGKSRAVLM